MPLKLLIFLLCTFAINLVIDGKLFLAIGRQMFPCTAQNSRKIPYWTRNKLVSTSLQDIVVKQKVSLFIPAPTKSTNTNFSSSACKSTKIVFFLLQKTINSSLSLVLLNSFLLKDSLKWDKTWQTLSRQDDEISQHSVPQYNFFLPKLSTL